VEQITTVGIDLAKNVFSLHGVDSTGKTVLRHASGHISKRVDAYLRNLLVQGARSVLHTAAGREDRLSRWVLKLQDRRGYYRTLVAIANKNARIAWALLARDQELAIA
jgi:hypothetical protein